MSLSSFCVRTNALMLKLFDMYNAKKDKKVKNAIAIIPEESDENKEENKIEKTMKIEGMMCGHCEARVKKVLEALDQVESAAVSHEAGTAVVTLKSDVADDVLKKAVEDQDYKVLSVQ